MRILPLLLLCASTSALADAGSPYSVDWGADGAVMLTAGAAWLGASREEKRLVTPACPCAASSVDVLDRPFAGRRVDSLSRRSDEALAALLAAPLALDAGAPGYSRDVAVMAEAVMLNGAVGEVVKLGVHRPRPFVYGTSSHADLEAPDSYLSFYSAHTSTAFAAGLSCATTFALRHPDSSLRWVAYGGMIAAGTAIGALRVASGRHFPTDVLAGAAAGSAIGIEVPLQHAAPPVAGWRLQVLPIAGGGAALVSRTLE